MSSTPSQFWKGIVGSYIVGHWSASFELREGGTAHEGVMTGLDPVIHENTAHQGKHLIRNSILLRQRSSRQGGVDGRHKAGHDGLSRCQKTTESAISAELLAAANRRRLPSPLRIGRAGLRPHDDPAYRVADATGARARTRRPRETPEPGGQPVSPRWPPGPDRNPCPWPRRRGRRIRSPPSRRCRRGEIPPS